MKLHEHRRYGHVWDAKRDSSHKPGRQRTSMRQTHIDLAGILAEPNPQIDFRTSAHEVSTGSFLKAVTSYTNRAISEITKHRSAQEADKRRLSERIKAVEAETNQCKVKEIEMLASMSISCRVSRPTKFASPCQGGRGKTRLRAISFYAQTSAGNHT